MDKEKYKIIKGMLQDKYDEVYSTYNIQNTEQDDEYLFRILQSLLSAEIMLESIYKNRPLDLELFASDAANENLLNFLDNLESKKKL